MFLAAVDQLCIRLNQRGCRHVEREEANDFNSDEGPAVIPRVKLLFFDSRCSTYICLDVVRPIARIGELAANSTATDFGCLDWPLLHWFREFVNSEQLCAFVEEGFCSWTGEPGCTNADIPATKFLFRCNGTYVWPGEFLDFTASTRSKACCGTRYAIARLEAVAYPNYIILPKHCAAGYFGRP